MKKFLDPNEIHSPREELAKSLRGKKGGCLIAVDLDDTLLKTTAKISVRYRDGREELMSTEQYAKLKNIPHEPDFKEFSDPHKFVTESTVLPKNMEIFAALQDAVKEKMEEDGSRIIILTARSDFVSKEQVIYYLSNIGVDVDRVHFERAGNISKGCTGSNKRKIVESYLGNNEFSSFILIDDSLSNLEKVFDISEDRPDVSFHTFVAKGDGNISEHKSHLREGAEECWAKSLLDQKITPQPVNEAFSEMKQKATQTRIKTTTLSPSPI